MSVNIFIDKKSIHFKLRTDIHAALRTTLFKHNITMQELFDELDSDALYNMINELEET